MPSLYYSMNKHIETIIATDESGNRYTLAVWQKFIESRTLSGTSIIPGMKTIYDQNGHHVNVVDYEKGDFLVVETQTELKRTSP